MPEPSVSDVLGPEKPELNVVYVADLVRQFLTSCVGPLAPLEDGTRLMEVSIGASGIAVEIRLPDRRTFIRTKLILTGFEVEQRPTEEDLERRYVETALALGHTATVMDAGATRAGDIIIREGVEERISEVTWRKVDVDERGRAVHVIDIATEARLFTDLEPNTSVTVRRLPREWAELLDPETAETYRRELILGAHKAGKIEGYGREHANRLLGVDLDTGETFA